MPMPMVWEIKPRAQLETPSPEPAPFLFSPYSLSSRAYVRVYGQSVCMSKLIPNFEAKVVHNGTVCSQEVRANGERDLNSPWSIWMGNSGFLTPGGWSWNGGMSSVSPTLLDPCFSGHLRVGVENWPQKHCECIQKWERKKKKPTESGLISTLLLWTPRAQPQGKLSKRLCGMHLRIIPLWDKKLGTYTSTVTISHWFRVALGALTLALLASPEKAKQVCYTR